MDNMAQHNILIGEIIYALSAISIREAIKRPID